MQIEGGMEDIKELCENLRRIEDIRVVIYEIQNRIDKRDL